MRTITDMRTEVRNVEVLITPGELAARLGYTGLEVMSVQRDMEDGTITIAMQGGDYNKKDVRFEPDTDSEEEVARRFGHDDDVDFMMHL